MPAIKDYLNYAEIALASYGQALSLGARANAPKYQRVGMAESQAIQFDQSWLGGMVGNWAGGFKRAQQKKHPKNSPLFSSVSTHIGAI